MLFGLLGPQRTGKTTLAVTFANQYAATYINASISKFIAELGLDSSVADYDFETRIKIQEHLFTSLYHHLEQYRDKPSVFITDRTFWDLIYYAVDAINESTSEDHIEWLHHYEEKCIQAQKELFTNAIYIKPGIPITQADTSYKATEMIQHKAHLLYMGILSIDMFIRPIPMFNTNLELRLKQLNTIIAGRNHV